MDEVIAPFLFYEKTGFLQMIKFPSLINHLSPIAERYITLLSVHHTKKYNYAARGYLGFPVIEIEQHGQKCRRGESWVYFAVPASAELTNLTNEEKLYVGAQTQDRMFRGDGFGGRNYHHAEMRAGNGNDNPIVFLESGNQIIIYRVSANDIYRLISENLALESLNVLAQQVRTTKKHLGWWYEQYVLLSELGQWRWNTAGPDKTVINLFS